MSIQITSGASPQDVLITGRIDTLTAGEFEEQVLPLITPETPSITLNSSGVDYISSSGLRVFILADKKSQEYNGTITIVGLNDFLKDIFDVSGLTGFFTFD